VVEGWIGRNGVRAAAAEFEHHAYQYVVTTGEPNGDPWEEDHTSFADLAARELIGLGLPKDKIIIAPAKDAKTQRTFRSAVAVWRALSQRGIHPKSLNVFTLGTHARRSCLVFSRVFQPRTEVGVVGWISTDWKGGPWWRDSDRIREMLTETAGYIYEAVLNSGRASNSPDQSSRQIPAGTAPASS
jgi:hypothetical protein